MKHHFLVVVSQDRIDNIKKMSAGFVLMIVRKNWPKDMPPIVDAASVSPHYERVPWPSQWPSGRDMDPPFTAYCELYRLIDSMDRGGMSYLQAICAHITRVAGAVILWL
jgi:hypothetical protein